MRYIVAIIIGVLSVFSLSADTLSLRECIATGIANNLSLLNARIGIEKAHLGVSQNRSRLLPVISGSFQMTGYPVSPVNVTTGTVLGNDFPDNPVWQTIKSMPYNAQAGVMMSVPLYNASVFSGVDVARSMEDIARLSYEKAVEELTVNIGRLYILARYSIKVSALLEANISRMRELCSITEALYQHGVVLELDLNRAKINLQNLTVAKEQSDMLYNQHINSLKYILDLSTDYPLELIDDEAEPGEEYFGGVDAMQTEIMIESERIRLVEKQIKGVRSEYIPSITFNAYGGGIAYQQRFDHFFHTSAAGRNWFGNCFLGITVNIPIFDGNSKKLRIRQYYSDRHEALNRHRMLHSRLSTEYDNALLDLRQNLEIYRAQTQSCRQAEDVYSVTEELYREGVASMTAVLQDEMQLRTAQSACAEARCRYDLARLQLLKLSGNLSLLSGE